MPLNWEKIDEYYQETDVTRQFVTSRRAKVPGGWLVHSIYHREDKTKTPDDNQDLDTVGGIAMVFVSDADWSK